MQRRGLRVLTVSASGLVLKVQKSDEIGPPTRDGGRSGESGARSQDGGGKGAGRSARQEKRSDRGAQMRSGDKSARGERSHQRSNVDVDVRGTPPTETERTGARGWWMSMLIAGVDPADGVSTSTCGAMGLYPCWLPRAVASLQDMHRPLTRFAAALHKGAPLSFSP